MWVQKRRTPWKAKWFPLHKKWLHWCHVSCFPHSCLSGRPGSRRPLLTSSTSPTLRGTTLRSQLFTWTGELYHASEHTNIHTHTQIKALLCWDFFVTHPFPIRVLFFFFKSSPHSPFQEEWRVIHPDSSRFNLFINRRWAIMDLSCENVNGIWYMRD